MCVCACVRACVRASVRALGEICFDRLGSLLCYGL